MRLEDGPLWIRVGRRLADRTRAPRRWWNPVLSYRRLSRDVLLDAYKQYADTTNRTILALLAVATFCLLTVISTPDKALLAPEGTIKVPFAEASISFLGFVVVAPFLLVVMCVYLHIFYGCWLADEHERQEYNTRLPEVQKKAIEPVPMLFALDGAIPRLLTWFILYWLTPVVLFAIARKGAGVPYLAPPLYFVFSATTAGLLFLQIRRREERRHWLICGVLWILFAGLVSMGIYTVYDFHNFIQDADAPRPVLRERLRRPLDLFRADLTGAYLSDQDLRGAFLVAARLNGANLMLANVSKAQLNGVNFTGANLIGAILEGADLSGANLTNADLSFSKLDGVNVSGADLAGADLSGADLTRTRNLTQRQVDSARLNEKTRLPADLKGHTQ